jgi:hypothetical protein
VRGAVRKGGPYRDHQDNAELHRDRRKLLPATIGYAIAIPIGLAVPILAVSLYFGLAVYWLFRSGRPRGCLPDATALGGERSRSASLDYWGTSPPAPSAITQIAPAALALSPFEHGHLTC